MEGICDFATWKGSPNFGYPRGTHGQLNPLAICDHIMCGTLVGCDSWFGNPNSWVSAHFGIGKNGEIHQYVSLEDCAWANGAINKPDPAIAHLYTGQNPNVVTWSFEHEGWPEDKWTEEMLRADIKLKRWLYQRRPGLILVGHYQFDSVNKANCPGPNWPKELLAAKMIADLKEEPMEIQDDFAGLRFDERGFMQAAQEAHLNTLEQQMNTLSAIRHSKHESPEVEMSRWKGYSEACDAEVDAIREAQERCCVHGRPG